MSTSSVPKNDGPGRVISFLNQKGGVGKTTMAFNVAHALAHRKKRVLCIDMDPQANLSLLFGIDPKTDEHSLYNIHHLLLNSIRELKALHQPIELKEVISNQRGVDLLPSGQDLSGFELTVAGISAPRQLILRRFIEKNQLKDYYDYIIVDGPPTLGLIVVNILCATDGILVPFQPDQFSRKGLADFHEVLSDIEDMGISARPQVIGYIPNLMEGRRKQSEIDYDLIKTDLHQQYEFMGNGETIFDPFFNKVHLVKSSVQKKSVFDFSSKEYLGLQEQFKKMARTIEKGLP